MTPSSGDRGATPVATGASGRRAAITIGRARDSRSSSSRTSSSTRSRAAAASVLAPAQPVDGRVVVGPAGEVEAADALDREHVAGCERREGRRQGRLAAELAEAQGRTAVGAGVGLGVEAAVERILVLGLAAVAHPEAGHRGQRPVVGDAADDREARPAVGAVDERIAVAAIGGVPQLGQAVGAGRGVGRDRRVLLAAGVAARDDLEAADPGRGELGRLDVLDPGQRRRLRAQPLEELVDRAPGSLHLEQDALAVVEHEAVELELVGQAVDVGPEADTLDGAGDPHLHAAHPISSRSACQALACASWIRGMCCERVMMTWSARPSWAILPPS
jgi:hypothetical protein